MAARQHNDRYSVPIVLKRTLARLRFVSKEWQSIVSDRTFARFHLTMKRRRPKEKLSGFFLQGRYYWCDEHTKSVSYIASSDGNVVIEAEKSVLSFLPEEVVILSSTQGLLCCRSFFPSPSSSKPRLVYVCNPLTKEWTSLEWPHPPQGKETSIALVLLLSTSPTDDVSTDFHLVSVCQRVASTMTDLGNVQEEDEDDDKLEFRFKTYSSQMKEWRESKEVCIFSKKLQKKGSVVGEGGGIIYWLIEDNRVLMFDFRNDFCWMIKAPFPSSQLNFTLGVCLGEGGDDGRLQYVLEVIE